MKEYWIPYKPFTPQCVYNKILAGCDHISTVESSNVANYNGHSVWLEWNKRNGYYIAEYSWAGRRVLIRTWDFKEALAVCLDFHDRMNGSGGSLQVRPNTPEDESYCEQHARLQPYSMEIANSVYKSMCTPQHEEMRLKAFRYKWDHGIV